MNKPFEDFYKVKAYWLYRIRYLNRSLSIFTLTVYNSVQSQGFHMVECVHIDSISKYSCTYSQLNRDSDGIEPNGNVD